MTPVQSTDDSFSRSQCRIGDSVWCDLVRKGASSFNVTVSEEQLHGFAMHARLLVDWNRRINLTRITDPAEMAISHFVDSLASVPYLPDTGRLLDIGSGGGFPGIPLRLVRPALGVLLVDAVRKKVSFLKHAVRSLSLAGTEAHHCRLSDLSRRDGGIQPMDVIVCRAVGQLENLLFEAAPLLAHEGRIIAYLGSIDDIPEGTPGAGDIRLAEPMVVQYRLPVSGARRILSIWRKVS